MSQPASRTSPWHDRHATDSPTHSFGDLVPNGKGWTRVGPLYCPNWHSADEPGWTQRCLPCACGTRHHMWTCHCGASIYAPKLGPDCRILNGPQSSHEDQARTATPDR